MGFTPWRIDQDKQVIIDPDAVALEPAMINLTQEQIRYMILAHDYVRSPYRLKPKDERKRLALERVYGTDKNHDPEKHALFRNATEAFMLFVQDSRYEYRDALLAKLMQLRKSLADPTVIQASVITSTTKSIKAIQDEVDQIELEISTDEEAMVLKAGKQVSWIEKYKLNKQNSKVVH